MRGAVVAAVAVVALLIGAGAGLEYGYMTTSGEASGLSKTVSSQRQQISSLGSMVPDSEIAGVQYAMTLYSRVNGSLDASAYYTIWDIGLPYHAGHNVTLYVDASQLINNTGLMNITNNGIRTGGFSISSISPSLPQTADSGVTYGNRTILTVVLDTPSTPFTIFLQMYLQAYAIPSRGLPAPP